MSTLFLTSYVLLAALLTWEAITAHGIIRGSAVIRKMRHQRQKDRAATMLNTVPPFYSNVFGLEEPVTASVLEGESTALVFVDQDDESAKSIEDFADRQFKAPPIFAPMRGIDFMSAPEAVGAG